MKKVCFFTAYSKHRSVDWLHRTAPEAAPKTSGPSKKRLMKTEVDLIKKYDHEIRDYYREIYDIGLDGIIAMSNKDQVKYTDIAVD